MAIKIEKAQRKQGKLRLTINGPSGSGKTMSALLIAFGLGDKVLVGDTENRSAAKYAEMDEGQLAGKSFDIVFIDQPYTVEKYIEVIEAAEQNGYDVLILDSLSHVWAGEGGLLQQKEQLDSRGGRQNQYTNWGAITKQHERLRARLLNCKVHLICTMRSKQEYAQVEKDGKKTIEKLGMAPIQRDGMEYEFDAVFDLAMDHSAVATKHRTGSLLEGKLFKPSVDTGKALLGWLTKGAPEAPAAAPAPAATQGADPAVAFDDIIREALTHEGIEEQDFLGWLFSIQESKKRSWVTRAEDGWYLLGGKPEDIAFLANKALLAGAIKAFRAEQTSVDKEGA